MNLKNLTDKSVLSELLEFLLDKQLADQVVERYFAQTDALAQLQYFGVTDLNKLTADAKLQYYLLLLCEFAKRYALKPPLELGQICSSKVIGEYISWQCVNKKCCGVFI